jgi:hypothetical protein
MKCSEKDETTPATGSGSPKGCETSRLPCSVDDRPTDGGEAIPHTRRPVAFTPLSITGTHFRWRLNKPHGHTAAEMIWSNENSSYLIGNRTRYIQTVHQPTILIPAH